MCFSPESPDLAALPPLDPVYQSPNITYVGCFYDGVVSKSLYKFEAPMVPNPQITEYNAYILCSQDFNSNTYDYTTKWAAKIHSQYGTQEDEYFALTGYPFCYKYKAFAHAFYSSRMFQEINVPLESCSDCEIGKVKIYGVCTCPTGYVAGQNGCERSIHCENPSDFNSGKCVCDNGNKAYSTRDLLGRTIYTCKPPRFTQVPDTATYGKEIDGTISGSANLVSCEVKNGYPRWKLEVNLTNTSAWPVEIRTYCQGAVNVPPTGGPPGGFSTESGSTIFGLRPGETVNQLLYHYPSGLCYDYVIQAIDMWAIKWEQNISIPFPHCGAKNGIKSKLNLKRQ